EIAGSALKIRRDFADTRAGEVGVLRSVAMECPICKYPVLAEGSTCRRCGAPLHVPIIEAKVPGRTALLGKRTVGVGRSVETPAAPPAPARPAPDPQPSTAARAAAYVKHAPPDALLPGAFSRRDNLLPRATRSSGSAGRAAPPTSGSPVTVRVGPYTVPIVG